MAGSFLSYVHTTYPDVLIFSMHENNRVDYNRTWKVYMHVCEIHGDSSTALGQAPRRVSLSSAVSVGRRCFVCISSVGAWTDVSPTLRRSPQRDKTHDAAEPSKGYIHVHMPRRRFT